jgi:hypothetical protein
VTPDDPEVNGGRRSRGPLCPPTRIASAISTGPVAAIAAWSSWSHMVHVALRYGERPEVAYVLPLSVDGMLVVASAAMVEGKRAQRPVRWSARLAFLAGVTASVAANIVAAHPMGDIVAATGVSERHVRRILSTSQS